MQSVRVRFLMLVLLILAVFYGVRSIMSWTRAAGVQYQLTQIYTACHAYAERHDGNFPAGQTSNEALRTLYQADLLSDESLCLVKPVEGWGTEGDSPVGWPQVSAAGPALLSPGECSFTYIKGHRLRQENQSAPLIFARVGCLDGHVYITYVETGGTVHSMKTADGLVQNPEAGTEFELLGDDDLKARFNIDRQNVLPPEGLRPGVWEIPAPQPSFMKWTVVCGGFLLLVTICQKLGNRRHSA